MSTFVLAHEAYEERNVQLKKTDKRYQRSKKRSFRLMTESTKKPLPARSEAVLDFCSFLRDDRETLHIRYRARLDSKKTAATARHLQEQEEETAHHLVAPCQVIVHARANRQHAQAVHEQTYKVKMQITQYLLRAVCSVCSVCYALFAMCSVC